VLHLLYARFWTKAMRDLGLVNFSEPFTKLFTQGMLLNESYYRDDPVSGKPRWFYPSEVDVRYDDKGHPVGATSRADGQAVMLGGIEKMSKSKNNVVEPRDIIKRFGADTARVFTMFAGPPDQSAAWSDSGAEGVYRFLRRLWEFARLNEAALRCRRSANAQVSWSTEPEHVRRLGLEINSVLKQVSADYDRLQYNTVVSGVMKMLKSLENCAAHPVPLGTHTPPDSSGELLAKSQCFSVLIRVLYPAAPHITHALWTDLGFATAHGDLIDAPWPTVDEAALVQDEIELVLQVAGKLRGAIRVPAGASREAIEAAALAAPEFARFSEGKAAKKVVIVPGRLVNVVI
jgi:leucyl-tRNA synthetase